MLVQPAGLRGEASARSHGRPAHLGFRLVKALPVSAPPALTCPSESLFLLAPCLSVAMSLAPPPLTAPSLDACPNRYEHVKRASTSPGPGAYTCTPAVGLQVASTKPSTPRFGFGTSDRHHQEKVYLSAEHERSTAGRDSPGPGQYVQPPTTGQKQPQSNIHSASSWGFGTASRFVRGDKNNSSPGPGSYVV